MSYVWVFELFCVFETAYMFLEPIVNYNFWYMENWLFSNPLWYNCKIKKFDLCRTYYFTDLFAW